jgi:hypothetical protein
MSEHETARQLLTVTGEIELAKRLAQCESVRRFDDPKESEAAAIADALGDLEKVFRKYLDTLLPKVLAASTCEELDDVLFETRVEFQEIVWHLWYPKSFREHLLGEDSSPPWIDTRLRP